MDPGSWLWAGRGECSRMCLRDRTALMCPGTPAEQARVLSRSQDNNFWNLTNGKLLLKSAQESEEREAPHSIITAEACPSPFSWNTPPSSMHWSIVYLYSERRKLHVAAVSFSQTAGTVSKVPGMYKFLNIKEVERLPLQNSNNKETSKNQTTKTFRFLQEVFPWVTELSVCFMTVRQDTALKFCLNQSKAVTWECIVCTSCFCL